jgi:hypothetical protein
MSLVNVSPLSGVCRPFCSWYDVFKNGGYVQQDGGMFNIGLKCFLML